MFNFFRRKKRPDPLAGPHWARIRQSMRLLQGLTTEEWRRLEARMRHFLADKVMSGAQGLRVRERDCLIIAAQACLMVCNLDDTAYRGWHDVVLYPSAFVHTGSWNDEAGLLHEVVQPVFGMARSDGPVLLSLPHSQVSEVSNGRNVVIHEFAHKLDMLNGAANGSPPLHAGMNQKVWTDTLSRGYRDFCWRLDHGQPVAIDAYAAQNPAEFFAVLSEYFFETPYTLAHEFPAIYDQFRLFYRQDPRERQLPPQPTQVPYYV